ncbi:putative cyclin-dependent protein kinase [Paratrimastix pyriformis]|uniref:non-specific serine/threonine protein kinase n=1 Tax=Paratrimastix pyriformis TaxID=342808 RepID=A0ABQ8UF23_9EUKA|nr:putative cyclin-dependent protein kinase [Paratrimastix pyriformis]
MFRNHAQLTAVIPFVEHQSFREFLPRFTIPHIRRYMYELLRALKHIHAKGIIHRDIKPNNFLFHFDYDRFALIDFGLAEKQKDVSGRYPSRGGTRGFRAPEVLIRCFNQTTAIDIWSVGVILMCILTRRYPLFETSDDCDGLMEIARFFGTDVLVQAARKQGLYLPHTSPDYITPVTPEYRKELHIPVHIDPPDLRVVFRRIWPECPYEIPDDLLDFLRGLMRILPSERLTATQALQHPFITGAAAPPERILPLTRSSRTATATAAATTTTAGRPTCSAPEIPSHRLAAPSVPAAHTKRPRSSKKEEDDDEEEKEGK